MKACRNCELCWSGGAWALARQGKKGWKISAQGSKSRPTTRTGRTASSRNGARPWGEGSIAQTAPNPASQASPVPMNRGWVQRWKLDSGWIYTGPVPMMVKAGCWMACENSNARRSWGLLQNVREKALTDDSGGPTLYKVRTTVPCPAHWTHFMSICPSFEGGEEAWKRAAQKMTSASGMDLI